MKAKIILILISVGVLLTGYAHPSFVDYQLIFQGFVESDTMLVSPPQETQVFDSQAHWEAYAKKYFNRMPSFLGRLNQYVDYSKQKLVCQIIMPTHENYNVSAQLDRIKETEGVLNMETSNTQNNIYVVGSSADGDSVYYFMFLATVDNADLLDSEYQ